MTFALSQLTATRRCILGNSDTVEISEGATQADASEFESVIASAMMQLTKALENGLRIKASPYRVVEHRHSKGGFRLDRACFSLVGGAGFK
jgi:hypothetical protein